MSKLMVGVLLAAALATAAEPIDGIHKIGGDVKAPQLKKHVDADYPEEARQERISGVVKLQGVVNAEGVVVDIVVLQSLTPGFDRNAIAALQQWRFDPAMRNGVAVAVRVNFDISFRYLDSPPRR